MANVMLLFNERISPKFPNSDSSATKIHNTKVVCFLHSQCAEAACELLMIDQNAKVSISI